MNTLRGLFLRATDTLKCLGLKFSVDGLCWFLLPWFLLLLLSEGKGILTLKHQPLSGAKEGHLDSLSRAERSFSGRPKRFSTSEARSSETGWDHHGRDIWGMKTIIKERDVVLSFSPVGI